MGTEQDLRTRTTGSAYGYTDSSDPDAIKRDIDRTRSEMDETIDALSAKLQPRNLVHEALGWAGYSSERAPSPNESVNTFLKSVGYDLLHSFRDSAKDAAVSGTKKAGATAWGVAKCHPLPSALIGAGLAWLAYEGSCSISQKARAKGWTPYTPEPEYGGSYVDARTGRPYHAETYGAATTGSASARAAADRPAHSARPTPDPTYGGSYVDARTGQPYTSSYGQEAQSMMSESHESSTGAACPPGHSGGSAGTGDQSSRGMTDRVRESAAAATGYARDTVSGATESVRGGIGRVGDAARGGAHYVTDTARSATHGLTHGVSSAGHTVRSGASNAAHTLTSAASAASHRLTDTTRTAAHQVRSGYEYGRERMWHAVDEYPLAVGAVALGAGLLLGLALPKTRREEELLGDSARQVKERARQASQEALERGRRAARETVSAVTEEVERQGLTPSGLKGTMRDFASRAMHDLREDAAEAGLSVGAVKEKAMHVAERAQETAKREVAGGEDTNADDSGDAPDKDQA